MEMDDKKWHCAICDQFVSDSELGKHIFDHGVESDKLTSAEIAVDAAWERNR